MDERKIVSVQFQDKTKPEGFGGRAYTYYSNVELEPGDIIVVPTARGDGIVRVFRTDVKDSEIDERIAPFVRTIENLVRPAELEAEE
jgi:hypothetical protein